MSAAKRRRLDVLLRAAVTCLEPGANANDAAFLSVCIHDLSADFGSGALDNRLRPDV